jgi:hypothetical protein
LQPLSIGYPFPLICIKTESGNFTFSISREKFYIPFLYLRKRNFSLRFFGTIGLKSPLLLFVLMMMIDDWDFFHSNLILPIFILASLNFHHFL